MQLQSESQQQHQRQHILNASDMDETTSASAAAGAASAAQKLADGGIQMPASAGGDDTSLSDPEFDDVFDILFRAKTHQPPLPFSMLPSDLRDLSLTNLESAADAFGQSAFYDDPLVNFPDQTFDSHPPSTIASSNPDLTSISHSNCSPAAQLSFKDSFAFPASAGTATSNSSADDDFDFTNNDSATDFDERFSFVRDILTKASTSGGNEVKPEVVESEASIRISSNAELMEWVDLLTQQSVEVDFLTDVFPEMHTNRSSRDPVLTGYKSKDYVDNFKFEVTVDRSNEDFVF